MATISTGIYHITHVSNLPEIIVADLLYPYRLIKQRGVNTVIGFDHIKRRRLDEIEVNCHPDSHVGDYVPFYFCPR
ncbi:MAG: DUF4433 domain-containing protein, partial [Planctomycetes bacterium]|nr:DUF4433 domain-containing protein [Planctomycetota bacterium]